MTDYVISRGAGEISFGLYGEIGKDLNGHEFARVLTDYVSQGDYQKIHIHINSQGGNVVHGMSIFTALYNMRNKVEVHIDGVALSMAGVIAMAGRRVVMNDFSRLMLHNPFIKGSKSLTEQEQGMINQMRGMLTDIFVNLRGLEKKVVEDLMEAETWFTAPEALAARFVDEVISTGVAAITAWNNAGELVSKMSIIINTLNLKTMDLKKLYAALSLDDGADENKVLAALNAKDTQIAQLTAQVADLNAKVKTPDDYIAADISKKLGYNGPVTIDKALDAIDLLNAKATMADTLKTQHDGLLNDRINEILAQAVADRKFPATQKSYYRTLLQNDFETGKRIIAGLNPVQRIADFVASGVTGGGDRSAWKYEDYQKKDPSALIRMEAEAPEIFAALYLDHYGKAYQK